MLRIAASLLLLVSAGTAEDWWLEEELPFVDIRLGYGLIARPDSYPVTTSAGVAYSDVVVGDSASALSYSIVGGLLTPVGALFGAELVYAWDSQELDAREVGGVATPAPAAATELQYQTLGVNVMAGLGLKLTRNLHVEALGMAGIGAVDLDFADLTLANKSDGEGWYWNAGVRGGLYWTWRRLVVGGLLEWKHTAYDAQSETAGSTTSFNESVSGIGGRLEIGYHIP